MPDLCGAWLASGEPIAGHLGAREREGLKARMRGGPGGLTEWTDGPLWIAAAGGNMARDGSTCLAVGGFVAFGGEGAAGFAELLKAANRRGGIDLLVPGHYVLAYADLKTNTLSLYREISGGERLFYARRGDLWLFSTSVRPLLAYGGFSRKIDSEVAAEFVLNAGGVAFGNRTLFDGIEELSPGEALTLARGRPSRRRFWEELPPSPAEDPPDAPDRLWRLFMEATSLAIGKDRQVAISLSGGLDSSAIAACAVELLGPGNVHAFTFEFDEPSYPSETPFASLISRRLGIEHTVVRVTYDDCLRLLPEMFWRIEYPTRGYNLPAQWIMRCRMRELGFRKELSGSGLEQPMGFSKNDPFLYGLAPDLDRLPFSDWALRGWRASRFAEELHPVQRRILAELSRRLLERRPGLMPPPVDFYYSTLALLRHNGIISDVSRFYPSTLRPLVRQATRSRRVEEAVGEIRALPLLVQLRCLNYRAELIHTMSLFRHTLSRDLGMTLAAPSYFMYGSPWGRYFSWRPDNHSRRDKSLLRTALQDRLPPEILARPKVANLAHPPAWRARWDRDLSSKVLGDFKGLAPFADSEWRVLERRFPRALFRLGLWHRISSEAGLDSGPPRWSDL